MKTTRLMVLAAVSALAPALLAEVAVGTAKPISVDLSASGQVRPAGTAQVNYGPDWAAGKNMADVQAEMLAVTHIGQETMTTQVLVSAASSSGSVDLAPLADGTRCFRLLLRTKSGTAVLGELVRDISIGERSDASDDALADSTDDRLLHAIDFGFEVAPLAYDAAWFGSEPLTLTYECEEMVRKNQFSGVTNSTALSSSLTGAGTYSWPLKRGNARHRLILSGGATALDAEYSFYSGFGFLLMLR